MDTPFPSKSDHAGTSAVGGRDALSAHPAGASPPESPRLVIRGESWITTNADTGEKLLVVPLNWKTGEVRLIPIPDRETSPYSAITDWLNCSFPTQRFEGRVAPLLAAVMRVLGDRFAPAVSRNRGLHGYEASYALGDSKAILAFGGNRGTAFLSLSGESCAMVGDWAALREGLESQLGAKITRWDGAVDDYLGLHPVESALELYKHGSFGTGGNMPALNQHGNWIEPDGRGRTLEIGKRRSGKMLRVYEKGMQLGSAYHPWVRWELELRNEDREIPWDVLVEPGRYLVGAYPKAMGWVQAEMARIPTIQKQLKICYDQAIYWASMQYGPLIDLMMRVEGSADAVVARLARPVLPRRVQHPAIDNIEDML